MTEYPNVYDEVIQYFPDLYESDDGGCAENNGFRLRHMTIDADGVTIIAEISFPKEYYQFWLDIPKKEMNVVGRTISGAEKHLWHDEPLHEWERITQLFRTQLRAYCKRR